MIPKTIEVPLQQEQVLEVVCDDLPSNSKELTDIFRQEGVALTYYCTLATEYYNQGRQRQSIEVLEACLQTANESPLTQPRQKLPILSQLVTLHLALASEGTHHFSEIDKLLNDIERIHSQYEPALILKGNYLILRRNYDDAEKAFQNVLDRKPESMLALMGIGECNYETGHYGRALQAYRYALKHARGAAACAKIRFELARCFLKMGRYGEARLILERCLATGGAQRASVLTLLAITELNRAKEIVEVREEAMGKGLEYLEQAYQENPKSPLVLALVAEFLFYRDNDEKAEELIQIGLEHTQESNIKAELLYQSARSQHKKGDYEKARELYSQAVEADKHHQNAKYGLGQIYLVQGETDEAIKTFESLPSSTEIDFILGSLYTLKGDKEKARKKLIKDDSENIVFSEDPIYYAETGALLEESDPETSMQNFARFRNICENQSNTSLTQSISKIEVYNNLAVQHFRKNEFKEAERHYSLGIRECELLLDGPDVTIDEKEQQRISDLRITLRYNLGLLYEKTGEYDKARAIFQLLITEYPNYLEAHLRIAAIDQALGRHHDSIEHAKEILEINQKEVDGWILLGRAQQALNEKSCKRAFEKVLKSHNKDDIYCHVALGNYHASQAREMKGEKQKEQRYESYRMACGFYRQALKRDYKNIYAANGLAIVLAETGHVKEANTILSVINEATSNDPNVLVNLAHFYVEQKQFYQAITMYRKAQENFYKNRDVNVWLYIARAQYMWAKETQDSQHLQESLQSVQRAYLLKGDDLTILYDIALCQQAYAQMLLGTPVERLTQSAVKKALQLLESSQSSFHSLNNIPADKFVLYERKVADQREKFGATLLQQAQRRLQEIEKRASQKQ